MDDAPPYLGEVLATADLTGRRSGKRVRLGGVTYGRPQLGRSSGQAELLLAFALAPPPPGTRYTACYLRVRFDDPGVRAVSARPLGDGPPGSFFGSDSGAFGWFAGRLDGSEPIPSGHRLGAVIAAPPGAGELTGVLRVDATVATGAYLTRSRHACASLHPAFRVRLAAPAAGHADQNSRFTPEPIAAGVRLCCAADVERFSRFRNPEAGRAQRRFVELLARARGHARIEETGVHTQASGDGQFAVLPGGLDEASVIPQLIEGLRIALAEVNADLSTHARLRIRVALDRGHIAGGANGWIGDVPIAVHRLLDSPAVRAALAEHAEADFALIVSDVVYGDVIAHHDDRSLPESFIKVNAVLPAKNFAQPAWVHVPRRP
ncbi:hypothetical protein [Nonomuraea typhae]|uniref:Uncharacterized protein n=1 Tax=Nonomuraea typhae TaxID=2603600 RepID=A0ABW7Z9W5_9ACTN